MSGKAMPKQSPSAEYDFSDNMNYKTNGKKPEIIKYCEKNDITLAQFGRWSDEWFLNCFPDKPPVGGLPEDRLAVFPKKKRGRSK